MGRQSNSLRQKQALARKGNNVIMAQQSEMFSGPLPHPDILAKYDAALPGAAERILKMAEEQGQHRRSIEKDFVKSKISDSMRGQWFALIIGLVAILGGVFLIYSGCKIEGYSLMFVPLASLVGVYFFGRRKAQQEREQKRKDQ